MKKTIGEWTAISGAMRGLLAAELPVKASLVVATDLDAIETKLKAFRQKEQDLVKKYGSESKGQVGIGPQDENWPKFLEEYAPLLSIEMEVGIEQVPVDSLDGIRVRGELIARLRGIVQ